MGQIGIWQIVIVGVVTVLLFGRGKVAELMGDVGKGIASFKRGLKDQETPEIPDKTIQGAGRDQG